MLLALLLCNFVMYLDLSELLFYVSFDNPVSHMWRVDEAEQCSAVEIVRVLVVFSYIMWQKLLYGPKYLMMFLLLLGIMIVLILVAYNLTMVPPLPKVTIEHYTHV